MGEENGYTLRRSFVPLCRSLPFILVSPLLSFLISFSLQTLAPHAKLGESERDSSKPV